MTIHVDAVEFTNNEMQEIRGYYEVEYGDFWVTWKWRDEALRLTTHSILSIATTEEKSND